MLHLGFDTRVYRIDPGPKVSWIDVDLPDVIELREKLYPERDGYRRIGASVTDHQPVAKLEDDRPIFRHFFTSHYGGSTSLPRL